MRALWVLWILLVACVITFNASAHASSPNRGDDTEPIAYWRHVVITCPHRMRTEDDYGNVTLDTFDPSSGVITYRCVKY